MNAEINMEIEKLCLKNKLIKQFNEINMEIETICLKNKLIKQLNNMNTHAEYKLFSLLLDKLLIKYDNMQNDVHSIKNYFNANHLSTKLNYYDVICNINNTDLLADMLNFF